LRQKCKKEKIIKKTKTQKNFKNAFFVLIFAKKNLLNAKKKKKIM